MAGSLNRITLGFPSCCVQSPRLWYRIVVPVNREFAWSDEDGSADDGAHRAVQSPKMDIHLLKVAILTP